MTKTLAERQFGPHAADYATSDVHAKGESLQRLVALARPQPGWRVLDVATGAGHMAIAFAPHVRAVVASDITDEMLAEAAKGAAAKGLTNVTTAAARATALPFEDGSFEAVVCRLAAHHFDDIPAFVAEARRVLVAGGIFGLVDNVAPDAATLPGAPASEIVAAGRHYNAFELLRDPSHVRALTAAEWREVVRGAGFEIVAEELLAKELAFDPWVKRMSCPPAVVARLGALLDNGPQSLRDFLLPGGNGPDRTFTLREFILAAVKPG